MNQLRALIVLGVHGLLLVLAAPGLETLRSHPPKGRAWVAPVQAWDAAILGPVEKAARPVERLFGAHQAWQFYRTGASEVRRFEIEVDGQLWHRSEDGEHTFLHWELASPRMRHMVKDWVRGRGASYGPGLLRYVVDRVHAVEPAARQVTLRGTESSWPGRRPEVVRELVGEAPDWAPRKLR